MRFFKAVDGCTIYLRAIVFNIIMQLCVSVPLSILQSFPINAKVMNFINIFVSVFFQLAFFCAFYFYVKKNKVTPQYGAYRIHISTIIISILLAVLCIIAFYLPAQWWSIFLDKIGYKSSIIFEYDSIFSIITAIIIFVGISPIMEELVFRCALLSGLRTKHGPILSALLVALAFSFMHMNPQQTVYQFFLGFVCALLVISNASIIPAIILHAVNNLLAITMDLAKFDITSYVLNNIGWAILITFALLLVGITLIFVLIKKVHKIEGRNLSFDQLDNKEESASYQDEVYYNGGIMGKKTYKVYYFISLLICVFMWIIIFIMGNI